MNSYIGNTDVRLIENLLIETFYKLTSKKVDRQATIHSLNESGVDSLEMLEAFIEIEEHLDISIPDDILDNDNDTISQLAHRIYQLTLKIDV